MKVIVEINPVGEFAATRARRFLEHDVRYRAALRLQDERMLTSFSVAEVSGYIEIPMARKTKGSR